MIRSAATEARGIMLKIMFKPMKALTIRAAYVENTTISEKISSCSAVPAEAIMKAPMQ